MMSETVNRRRSRRSRGTVPGAPLAAAMPPVRPGLPGGSYKPLSHQDMQRIHQTALTLLEQIGLAGCIPSLTQRALERGAQLDGNGRLRLPRALVEDVIANTRRRFILHGFAPEHDLDIGGQRVNTGTGGAAPKILDFETGAYRESTLADLYDIARLVDRLAHIHWFHRSVVACDMPTPLDLDINTIYACLAGTSKSIAVSFAGADHVRAGIDLFDTALGGTGRFGARPFCTAVCCHVVPPMRFGEEACEVLEQAVLAKMPVLLVAAGQAGTTSPAALAGSVAQSVAEVLAGLVLCNLVDPQCRAIFAAWPFVSDLRTGAMSGGSAEQALLMAASAQMAAFYDLPSSVAAGMTDSKVPDAQSGAEKGYTITLAAQAGACMVHESAGMHASLMGTVLESYVADNDLLGAVQRTVRGIEVNDETLSIDVIKEVVNGDGHFLGAAQTLALMKSDYLYPEVGNRLSVDQWIETGAQEAREPARDRVRRILAGHYPEHLNATADARIRKRFNILLPRERMLPGNGVW